MSIASTATTLHLLIVTNSNWVKASKKRFDGLSTREPFFFFLVEENSDQRGTLSVKCGALNSFHPVAMEQTAVYISLNGAETSRTAEEGEALDRSY